LAIRPEKTRACLCLAVMISKQCVRQRSKGWGSRSCRTGWREMTLTVARWYNSFRKCHRNHMYLQEYMRYARYVTHLPESRYFSTHCVNSSNILQNGQHFTASSDDVSNIAIFILCELPLFAYSGHHTPEPVRSEPRLCENCFGRLNCD